MTNEEVLPMTRVCATQPKKNLFWENTENEYMYFKCMGFTGYYLVPEKKIFLTGGFHAIPLNLIGNDETSCYAI